MKRYMSGTEVEQILAAVARHSDAEELRLMEGELEGGRLWETDDYPGPAFMVGRETNVQGISLDRARFGWDVGDLIRWIDERDYIGTRERQDALSGVLWELGFEKESHGLVIAVTGARKG